MSEIQKARELEKDRFLRSMRHLTEEEMQKRELINSQMAARGAFNSGGRLQAFIGLRREKMQQIVKGLIDTRGELSRRVPELGSEHELKDLLKEITSNIRSSFSFEHVFSVKDIAAPAPLDSAIGKSLRRLCDNEASRLQALAKQEIDILKGEIALNLHRVEKGTAVSVNTAGGPAVVNLGEIRGGIRQVVGTLNEAGQAELAAVLDKLSAAIEAADNLGGARQEYLEQVKFIAEQATAEPAARKGSIVKGLIANLRARLDDVANVAQILSVAGPVVAKHFGYPWPI